MFDVAIIGAGPSGSMAARLLADRGHEVVLLEEHSQPGDPVNCSGIIGVEAFQRFDLPTEPIIRGISNFCFYSPGGVKVNYRHPGFLAYAVNRASFDVKMASLAIKAGAHLKTGARVDRIQIEQNAVHLNLRGQETPVESRFVVIATGAGSRLIQQVGLKGPQKHIVGAQTECPAYVQDDVEIHFGQSIAPSNFGWVIPLQNGFAKVGLISRKDAAPALRRFLMSSSLENKIQPESCEIQTSILPLDTMPQSYTDRTIVVGEAAGQLKAITCGGIYYGMLAAEIAGDVLDQALKQNQCDAAALSLYERRWRKLLDNELKAGMHVRSAFEKFSDSKIEALFEIAYRDEFMKLIRSKANFDWHRELISVVLRHGLTRAIFQPLRYAKIAF